MNLIQPTSTDLIQRDLLSDELIPGEAILLSEAR
jgi:hypothetical protein